METHPIPEVREAYFGYAPPIDVAALVRELLGYVPEEHLRGLRYIVLSNASSLSRADRRRRVSSRGQKHLVGRCLGVYYRSRAGEPPHIVLYVDRIIDQTSRLALRVSMIRDVMFASTLYHEVGHHIHLGLHPKHREPEDVADSWAARLRNAMLLKKYPDLDQAGWQRVRSVAAKLWHRRHRQSAVVPAARSEG